MRTHLVGLMVMATVAVAHAQAPGDLSPPPKEIILHKKDPNKATLLTGLGIAVPAALVAATARNDTDDLGPLGMGIMGSFFLPAAGHWYAGRVGTYGLLARMGGFSFAMAGLSEIDDAKKCARGIEVTDGCDGVSRGVGRAMVGVGVTMYVGSLVYDFMSSRREVHEYNSHYKIQVMPMVTQASTGLSVGGAF